MCWLEKHEMKEQLQHEKLLSYQYISSHIFFRNKR